MRLLEKSHTETFNNERLTSDLDHVLASASVQLRDLGTRADGARFEVQVSGWVDLAGAARRKFIQELSDHSSLFVEVR